MVILLTYLMIGPSGAAVSVDRLLARWWRRRKGGASPASAGAAASPDDDRPTPSVSANIAMRLLQIHVCFIYAAAGFAKLQGNSWWTGTAVWGTLANSEFAPMQNEMYMYLLREMAANLLFVQVFLSLGTYFTLFFEISYAFLIWGKRTRWLLLFMAVVLHGVIGLFMGLKTFALMMLVMNMAFLPLPTVHWMLGLFRWSSAGPKKKGRAEPSRANIKATQPAVATASAEAGAVSTHVQKVKSKK
jgi:hypothetical protein